MVTIDQGSGQFNATGGSPQTQNPQQAPGGIQPNEVGNNNLQTVINSKNLFSTTQDKAILTLPGASSQTLLAKESDTSTGPKASGLETGAFITVVGLVLLVGSFLIIRKLTYQE